MIQRWLIPCSIGGLKKKIWPFNRSSDIDYFKLYKEGERRINELSDKLESVSQLIFRTAQNLAQNLRQKQLLQRIHLDHLQNDAHGAVLALLDEYSKALSDCCELENEKYNLSIQLRKEKDGFEEKLKQMIKGIQNKYDSETQGIVTELSRLQNEIHILETDKHKLESKHKDNIRQLNEQYEAGMRKMRTTHQTEKTGMQTEHDAEKTRMQTAHDAERGRLRDKISDMQQKFNSEKDQMKKNFNTKKVEQESRHATRQARMESDFKAEKLQLENERAAQEGRLRRDIESLNGALLARDRFTPIVDHELKSRFLDLVGDIDYLARLEWKFNQADWTNDLLARLSKNPRRLKKQILQDSLWIILYENIFCSPFRVFGEEGRTLEAQWSDAFGKGWCSPLACWTSF